MIPRSLLIGVAALLVLVIAMGIYLRHMRQQEEQFESVAASALPIAPPTSGATETVTLYVADDAAGILRARLAQIPLPGGRSSGQKNCCARCCESTSNRARRIQWLPRRTFAASIS